MIINMADRLKDDTDLKLESLFRSQWVRRLALPVAITVGTLIAAKPLLQLASAIPKLLMIVPDSMSGLDNLPLSSLPQNTTVIFGAMLLFAVMMVGKMLED